MKRRTFMGLLGTAAVGWPRGSVAEQRTGKARRVGWLTGLTEPDPELRRRNAAVVQALQELGWSPGRNLQIDYRHGDVGRFEAQAAELVALAPDALLSNSTPSTRALQQATRTIPIIFALVLDPVTSGLVKNLARPGGNVTGFTNFEVSMGGKWLELLKEVAPGIGKVALIFNPGTAPYIGMLQSIEAAAPSFRIEITSRGVADAADLERTIAAAGKAPGTALVVFPDIFTTSHRQQIIELAAQHRLPAIYASRFFAAAGGLMSYGIDTPDLFRRAAGYLDRMLRGEKPANLPVQAPNKFEFVINLKAAKALDLTISPTLIARADEVIE